MKDEKDYYLTTAITYTSGKPHIGNTYEIILALISIFCPCSSVPVWNRTLYPSCLLKRAIASAKIFGI